MRYRLVACVLAVFPAGFQAAVCDAQTQNDTIFSVAAYGGNIEPAQGATFSMVDVANHTSGVAQHLAPRFSVGIRADVEGGGILRFGLEGSTVSINAPVTLVGPTLVQQRTISFMESDIAFLAFLQLPLRVFQPYMGAGPAVFITHADREGGYKLAPGFRCVAGARILVGEHFYLMGEARFAKLGERTYTFDALGIQDSEFSTMSAVVSGSHKSLVIGMGWRLYR